MSIGSLDYGGQSCDRPRVPSLEPNTGMGTWLSSENNGSKLTMIVWGGFGPYRESLLTITLRLKTIISGLLLYVIFQLKITLFRTLFLIILKRARRPGICRKKTHQNYDLKILGCVLKKLQHRMILKMIFINKHSIFGKTLLTITVPITPNLTPEWTYNHGFTYGVYEGITFWNLGQLGVYFGFTKELLKGSTVQTELFQSYYKRDIML